MPDHQTPTEAPTTNPPPCQPQPNVTMHWPIEGATIQCGPPTADFFHGEKGAAIPLTITFTLVPGLDLSKDITLSLLYVVNGSLDTAPLFAQTEISRHSTLTFPKGQTTARFTILTLPIRPNTTFELEVLAYAAGAGTIISGPARAQAAVEGGGQREAGGDDGDKSLLALNALATTALVTALGALAFALLKSRK